MLEGVTDGGIIEFHLDGPAMERSTAAALPGIVAELKARGHTLVTVPEIVLPCPAVPDRPPNGHSWKMVHLFYRETHRRSTCR